MSKQQMSVMKMKMKQIADMLNGIKIQNYITACQHDGTKHKDTSVHQ